MTRILYISPTAMTEALGQSQVLEYLVELAKNNQITLFSFEKETDQQALSTLKQKINAKNIEWHHCTYTNRFGLFSTAWILSVALWKLLTIIRKEKPQVIHARSILAATLGWPLAKISGEKLLFDIRGFAIDEKVDNGRLKKNTFSYKVLRGIEDFLYRRASHIVTLTHTSKKILHEKLKILNEKITVIPTCANKQLFFPLSNAERQAFRTKQGFNTTQIILLHPGTINRYDFDKEIQLFLQLYQHNANFHFLILNEKEKTAIQEKLTAHQLSEKAYTIRSASFTEMSHWLNIADAALFFPKYSYATEAMAPTKFAEVVACHIPTITSKGTGDMGYYIDHYQVGLALSLLDFDQKIAEYTLKVQALLTHKPKADQYNALFSEHFDKALGIKRYQTIYNELS